MRPVAGIIKIKTAHTPPDWANDAMFVHQSMRGNQWVAALRDEGVVFAAIDPGDTDEWREFSISNAEFRKSSMWRTYPGSILTVPQTLFRVRFDVSELLWVVAVLHSVSEAVWSREFHRSQPSKPSAKAKE